MVSFVSVIGTAILDRTVDELILFCVGYSVIWACLALLRFGASDKLADGEE